MHNTAKRKRLNHVHAKTLARQALFLENYASVGVITAAARLAGLDRQLHYDWLGDPKKYPDYSARFAAAQEQANDRLETEAVRRAVQGWDEPVYGKAAGKDTGTVQVGVVRKYSDNLLTLLLKARRPREFRERVSTEFSGPDGGPVQNSVTLYHLPDNGRDKAPA